MDDRTKYKKISADLKKISSFSSSPKRIVAETQKKKRTTNLIETYKEFMPVRPQVIKTETIKEISAESAETIASKLNSLEGAIDAKVIIGLTTPKEVIEELRGLKGNERLDISNIRNGEQLAQAAQKVINMNDMRWHGGGMDEVIHDSTLTGEGTTDSPLSVVSSSAGYQVPTGSVNGINQVFTFTTAPSVIVVDQGRTMQRTSSDGTVNWTIAGTVVTLLIAPNTDIFSTN